jgi:hypothetical protein
LIRKGGWVAGLAALLAERDKNTCRLDFAPSVAKAITPAKKKAAAERKATPNSEREKFSPSEKGKASDKVAAAVGMSAPSLAKAKAVVDAAPPFTVRIG